MRELEEAANATCRVSVPRRALEGLQPAVLDERGGSPEYRAVSVPRRALEGLQLAGVLEPEWDLVESLFQCPEGH